jgi:hypothetical protein
MRVNDRARHPPPEDHRRGNPPRHGAFLSGSSAHIVRPDVRRAKRRLLALAHRVDLHARDPRRTRPVPVRIRRATLGDGLQRRGVRRVVVP